jgi:hypothetical protein
LQALRQFIKFFLLSPIVIIVLLVSACSSTGEIGISEPGPKEQVNQSADSETTVPALDNNEIEPPNESEPDACLECHTDKDRLIQTADPIEEAESENSGEG